MARPQGDSSARQLGFGLGLRPCHYGEVLENPPKGVDWFEIVSENFLRVGGRPRRTLEQLRRDYPIATHGVGLSIAGPSPLDEPYLDALKALVNWLEPALVTDHLCWTSIDGRQSHDLLPFPLTRESLEHVRARVDHVQSRLGRTLLLENPSAYISFRQNEMDEAEFLEELSRRTGCGVLLDLNNLFVNAVNLGRDPKRYLETLSCDTVHQFHLAGHQVTDRIRIDTHDGPVPDEVWELYQIAVGKWPMAACLLEWDDRIPPLAELRRELSKARRLSESHPNMGPTNGFNSHPPSSLNLRSTGHDSYFGPRSDQPETHGSSMKAVQAEFFDWIAAGDQSPATLLQFIDHETPAPSEVGIQVYHQGYFLRLRETLAETFPALYHVIEDEAMDVLVADYLAKYPPSDPSLDRAGDRLSRYFREHGHPLDLGAPNEVFAELADLEGSRSSLFLHPDAGEPASSRDLANIAPEQWSHLRLELRPLYRLFRFAYDVTPVWQAAMNGEDPPLPEERATSVIVYRAGDEVFHEEITVREANFLEGIQAGRTFFSACADEAGLRCQEDQGVREAAGFLKRWIEREMISAVRV